MLPTWVRVPCVTADRRQVESRAVLAYQPPREDGSFSGTQNLPARSERPPHPGRFGQHDNGSLHKPPRGTQGMPNSCGSLYRTCIKLNLGSSEV